MLSFYKKYVFINFSDMRKHYIFSPTCIWFALKTIHYSEGQYDFIHANDSSVQCPRLYDISLQRQRRPYLMGDSSFLQLL